MNKKIPFVLIVVILAIGACALGLVACDEPHEHSLTHTPAKEATCTGAGNIEYWYCEDCGKYFSDEAATTEVTQAETVIAATGHIYENHVCIKCGQADPNGTEGLEYELLDNDTYRVIGIGDATDTDIYIPSVYNGKAVISIGDQAFYNCSGLTSITIPDSVTSIGESAFSGCSGLESITIPFVGGSIKTASDTYQYPFGYIFGTSSYTGGVSTWQYYYGSSTSSRTSSDYYIPVSLKSVTVTGGNILYGAFSYCSGLTSITIPDSVTSIGGYAFA